MKTLVFLFLVGCAADAATVGAPPLPTCEQCIAMHSQCAQTCATCCETQPKVESIATGGTDSIHACGSSDVPSNWSVSWCRTDCESTVCGECLAVCK